mgnify:CR=1 FL=1
MPNTILLGFSNKIPEVNWRPASPIKRSDYEIEVSNYYRTGISIVEPTFNPCTGLYELASEYITRPNDWDEDTIH